MVYTASSLVLLVLVGTLALTSRQTPPPTIAEFAPQAVEQITDSSGDSAASRRAASGEKSALREHAGADEAAGRIADVARVRHCVGNPPRQIEDPQSPPCVPYWSGDNGGATWRGVTRDEIRVTDTAATWAAPHPGLEAFFNKRFEFYGRRIRLIPRIVAHDPVAQRASARAVYEEDQSFASTGWGIFHDYLDELARLRIVSASRVELFPEAYLAAHRPYLWTYPMANDRQFAMLGNWYCARFAGRNAAHAGDPLLQMTPRKAGIILLYGNWEGTSAEPMNAQLESCGARTDQVIEARWTSRQEGDDGEFFENAVLRMKAAGVTTLTCLGVCKPAMSAATNQGYFPEWLHTSFVDNHDSFWLRVAGPPQQLKSLMLLLQHPMERSYADHPSNWAVQEVSDTGYPTTSLDQWALDVDYWPLLLLASGIQMAGPHLTPETFERGLHRAKFPNPPHRIMAGAVGFSDGDHTMTDDAAEVWWGITEPSPYADGGPGTFCYVDHGARRRIGTFPADDPFFKGPCDNGAT